MIRGIHIDIDGKSGRGDSGKRSRGLCVKVRTKGPSSQPRAACAGRAPQSPQAGGERDSLSFGVLRGDRKQPAAALARCAR